MDRPLPKIGGITIERVSKALPTAPPSFGKQPNPVGPSTSVEKPFDQQGDENYPEDEYDDYQDDGGEGEQWHDGEGDVEMAAEEEEDEEMNYDDYETPDTTMHASGAIEQESKLAGPILPPGVTFERKIPVTATIKPNIKLPPGISFSKSSSSQPQAPVRTPPNQQKFPNQRNFPQISSQQVVYPRQNMPVPKLTPPVRVVRPRAKEPPRMMINDFLEQGMHVGTGTMAFPGRPRGRAPRAVAPRVRASRPRLPFPMNMLPGVLRSPSQPRSQPPNRQLLGPQKPPIPIESLLNLTAQSDSEDDLPLRAAKSLPGIKLPPGINLERKSHSPAKPGIKSDFIKLPLTPSSSRQKPVPPQPCFPSNIQLPAGISFERKKPAPLPQIIPEDIAGFEDEEEEEEEETGEENEEEFGDEYPEDHEENLHESYQSEHVESRPQPIPAGIQLPPGVTLQKSSSSNRSEDPPQKPIQTEESSDEHPEESGQEQDQAESLEVEEADHGNEEEGYGVEGEDFNEDGAEGEYEMGDETANNEEWNESHENEPSAEEEEETGEGNEDGDEHEQLSESHDKEEETADIPQEETEFHDEVDENAETAAEENDGQETAPESMEESMGIEAEEETDPMGEDEGQDANDVPNDFDPSAEIDFETLIAAPVVPTISSLSANSDDVKADLDEKADLENLMAMMSKGEIEGEIEEDEEDKKVEKRKANEEEEMDGESESKRLKETGENEGEGDEDGEDIDKTKVASSNLRKNIREVMDETKLDETTLAAQRQEVERLKRLAEQQRIVREVKRQIQMSKIADKAQNHSNALNLLRGNTDLTLRKSAISSSVASSSSGRSQDSVLLKMGNGQQACLNDKMRELLKMPGKSSSPDLISRSYLNRAMLSSSVTIAPIKKEPGEDKIKQKDVVELSSDSDDCVVLSEEEPESEPEDDPANSGLHTSDIYNIADEHGRVLVNVGHPASEPDVFLAPQIASIIKPHQIGGVRFLYDNIIESSERFESSEGFGCILAHSMGLGKTLQIVSFSDIFLRHTSAKKVLCIMPINTIQNWQAEYNMWLPKENLNGGDIRCREFDVYVVNESSKNIHSRGKVILDWHKNGGVLLMGYELFRLLSLRKPIKSKRKVPNDDEEKKNRDLVEDVYAALIKPGPDLVICDEGHRIKNSHATTSQALKQIRTKRRVVLTGYPLQNNLLEYWCMVDFVRPNYLGSKTEFSNMFERPIQNGQCIDSTPQDKRLMRFRAHVLHSQLEGFVQRRSHTVLQQVLPHKQEYVLLLRFTEFQSKLYKTFMNDIVRAVAVPNPLKAFAVCCKIWNHPDVLYNFLKKKGEQRDLDLEETLLPPTIPAPFGVDSLPPTRPLPNPTWPKRGPGSRGGRVRRGRGRGSPHNTVPAKEQTESLPSMSQFQMPNAASGARPSPSYSGTSSSYLQDSSFSQPLPSFSQTQQTEIKYPNYGNNSQGENFGDFDESKQSYGANYSQDPYYQNQFPQATSDRQDQYYQQGSQGYDYNQGSEVANDFTQMSYPDSGFSGSNFTNEYPQQQSTWGNNWGGSSQGGYSSSSDEFMSPSKFFDEKKEVPDFMVNFLGNVADDGNRSGPSRSAPPPSGKKPQATPNPVKPELEDKKEEKEMKKDDIPFEWAMALFKNYVTGVAENSSKMEVFLVIVEQSIGKGDRMLVFSQSLLTLDLIEEYLQRRKVPGREEAWAKNRNYFRLDGSTPAIEREKLINEFNSNENVQMFLVSTRAGSLGINLVGANRVVVFDASWNPCHDTQAVCRVYRYGQQKPCFVYRLVMDCCLEKKIYDRQVNKQGMADRIVDELNPDAHLALKDVTNLCWDDQEETSVADFSHMKDKYHDDIVKLLLDKSTLFSRPPFQHESLLVDRKEKKLSKAEKKLAKRSYELEKQAANNPRGIHHLFSNTGARGFTKPIASVKPMQSGVYGGYGGMPPRSKWIPVEIWQKQGMSAQEMTLPLDVVIPTNSPDKTSIVLKAGQRVMVLKSPKGIYMQLDTGKIIAIRTSLKDGRPTPSTSSAGDKPDDKKPNSLAAALKSNPNVTITKNTSAQRNTRLPAFLKPSTLDKQAAAVNSSATKGRVFQNKARPVLKKTTTLLKKPMETAQTTTPDVASPASQDSSEADRFEPVASETLPTTVPNAPQNEPPVETSKCLDWSEPATASSSGIGEVVSANPEMETPIKPQEQAQAPTSTPVDQPQPLASGEYSSDSKEVKKEADPQNPWAQPNYPVDPYGSYYPGYPGYYGPPMPGYDPYLGYPPMQPMKTEPSSEGTPPPAVPQQMPAARPPMYPPYHAPYPYHHYNYAPYPPQGQPGSAMPPAVPPTVKSEGGEANASGFVPPPYGPRPPYPQPSTAPPPGFYPNYPPYPPRPFHDPNYPYPNYNPYMPPAGYGYPVPNTPQNVNKPPAEGNATDTESSQ